VKRTQIRINGQLLSEVGTRSIPDYPTTSIVTTIYPDVFVQEDQTSLSIELNPVTLAQLYYDGTLPQDREIAVEVKVGRKKPRPWRIDSLVMRKDRWDRSCLVLGLVPA